MLQAKANRFTPQQVISVDIVTVAVGLIFAPAGEPGTKWYCSSERIKLTKIQVDWGNPAIKSTEITISLWNVCWDKPKRRRRIKDWQECFRTDRHAKQSYKCGLFMVIMICSSRLMAWAHSCINHKGNFGLNTDSFFLPLSFSLCRAIFPFSLLFREPWGRW